MQHVVFWSAPSGPTFQRVPELADAVELVQRLRNDHDVTDAEVHALTAVPLNFRTVVVVEPALGGSAVTAPPATAPSAPSPLSAVESSFAAFGHPVDDGGELAPLGASVPGVVPDPVGPFRSLSAVGAAAAADEPAREGDERSDEHPAPHLVGLPSVAPDAVEDEPHEFRPLEVVADAADAADEPAEPGAEAARSLGLFA